MLLMLKKTIKHFWKKKIKNQRRDQKLLLNNEKP